jgi:hypothetical protein
MYRRHLTGFSVMSASCRHSFFMYRRHPAGIVFIR